MKRWIAVVAVVLGLGGILLAIFLAPNDEEKIRGQLDRLGQSASVDPEEKNPVARGIRIKKDFEDIFTENVAVSAPELASPGKGRDGVVSAATRAGTYYQNADISFSNVKVELDGSKSRAKVNAVATLTGSRGGELQHETRDVIFDFAKYDGDWLIDSVTVKAPEK
jgi:hypothetical protein